MKNLENMKALNEMELAKVSGGKISPICLGEKGLRKKPKNPATAVQPAAGKRKHNNGIRFNVRERTDLTGSDRKEITGL